MPHGSLQKPRQTVTFVLIILIGIIIVAVVVANC